MSESIPGTTVSHTPFTTQTEINNVVNKLLDIANNTSLLNSNDYAKLENTTTYANSYIVNYKFVENAVPTMRFFRVANMDINKHDLDVFKLLHIFALNHEKSLSNPITGNNTNYHYALVCGNKIIAKFKNDQLPEIDHNNKDLIYWDIAELYSPRKPKPDVADLGGVMLFAAGIATGFITTGLLKKMGIF